MFGFGGTKELVKAIDSQDVDSFKEQFLKLKEKTKRMKYGDCDNWTVLHIACENDAIEIVKSIYEIHPAFPVDIQDEDGRTALQRSVVNENIEIARFLISKGANINIEMLNVSPMVQASLKRNFEMTQFLLDNGGSRENLIFAVFHSCDVMMMLEDSEQCDKIVCEKLNKLLEMGLDANEINDDGISPIFEAIELDFINCLKSLVAQGADVNFKVSDRNDMTPLDFAIIQERESIARYLMSLGADFNADIHDSEYVERLNKKAYPYELQFLNVNQDQIDYLKEHFNNYASQMSFDVTSHRFEEDEDKITIIFDSLKYFDPNQNDDGDEFLDPNKKADLRGNIYYRLIGKEQFFSNLCYTDVNFDDNVKAFFIDHEKNKWSAVISKYSGLTEAN